MSDQPSPAATPPPLLTWRVHPAARRPGAAALAGVVIITFSAVAAWTFGHWAWGLLSAAVLVVSLNRFFLPSTFAIDDKELTAHFPFTTRRLEWKHIRRVEMSSHDVVLAMNLRRTWLNANRESRVPFGGEKAKIVELIESRLPKHLTTESRSARSGDAELDAATTKADQAVDA